MNPRLLVLAAGLWLASAVVVLGARRSGYSQRRQTISELGESGSPDERLVGFGVFAPFGVATAVAALEAGPVGARIVAAAFATGYLAAAVAPCDPGCPRRGSTRNTVHLSAGVAEYLGIVVGLGVLAATVSVWFAVPGTVVALGIVGGTLASERGLAGVAQRTAEASAFIALASAL